MSDPVSVGDDVTAQVHTVLDRLAGDLPALGIALSGGGDSTALMHLVASWARGRRIMAATVDHGLRDDSAAEAQTAHRAALALDIPHATLLWRRDTDAGNLMAGARDARLRLLSGWAQRNDLPAIVLGHTQDDQAETLLMRLARGAGVDGLAGMADWRDAFGLRWLRPMLGVGRAELRDWLGARGASWIDDPSNDDDSYDRVRIRKAMAATELGARQLAMAADNIASARDALQFYAAEAAGDAIASNASLILPRRPFTRSPPEIHRRLIIAATRWITGADYPPRRSTVSHALAGIAAGNRVTMDGALFEPSGDRIFVIREPAAAHRAPAVQAEPEESAVIWDKRWRVEGLTPGQHVSALGLESLSLPEAGWRASGMGRDEAAATPAIWQDQRLIAAPVLRRSSHLARPLRGSDAFRSVIFAH
ncbi:tRNA lysidine(34) synthetase TilS [Paracoccus tegillarcae]|uniref:tRNA(Ile)-lysidine synthase n=1 Tax=Paracoccus tegillarcae TaxID=1529068 RepID=A0A2K9EE05_9RHOB|nr:tRNA lysidine(34) synthetase TilS [Paracoccus tegillarcae]AUH32539.1 tRNA lysidine(34) synthetase TilS [Paracoccus tegillarcae]